MTFTSNTSMNNSKTHKPLEAKTVTKNSSLKNILAAGAALTFTFTGLTESASAAELQQASLVSPSDAQTYYGSATTATDGLSGDRAEINETIPYAIRSLARSLGADRTSEITPAEYRTRVFEYVRDNIETLPYYGVKKGALGAYFDEEGTAFDQAMLMVQLIEEYGSLEADYKLGTITLNATQFENLFGITNATAATQLLADGGIPATVSSSGGTVTSVIMDYIWVSSGGTDYDVAYKKHTVEAGINIGTAMSGGGTTYSRVNFESDVDMDSTSYGWGDAYHTPDITAAENNLEDYATNLVSSFKDTHYEKSMDEIIGGRYLDPVHQEDLCDPGETTGCDATGTLGTPHKTISGDIPNQYRTAINIDYGDIDKTIYADEIYGLRLWLDGDDLMIGNAVLDSNTGTATTLTISVDHPYADDSGDYADHSQVFDVSDLDTAAIVFSAGSYSNQVARHVVNDDYQDSIVDDDDAPDTETMARLALAANWKVQFGQLMNLNSALASVTYQHHDTIGVIVSDSSDNISISLDSNISVNADNGGTGERRAAYATLQSMGNVFRSSLIDQARNVDGVNEVRSNASMIAEAFAEGNEIWEIGQLNSFQLNNLTGYDSGLISDISSDLSGSLSAGYLMVDNINSLEGNADAEPYIKLVNVTNGTVAHMISDLQGSYGQATDIGTAGALLGGVAGDIIRDNSPQAVSGEYGDSATDLVTGAGGFPMALAYTRSYQHSRRTAPNKGWMHNYDITADITSNSLIALSNPIAAAQAIATMKVVNDIHAYSLDSQGILTALIAENWLRKELVDNTFTVRTAGGADFYYKLADGTFEALSGSLAELTYASGSDEYTITALSDSEMIFENISNGEYRIKEMTWPNGIEVDFTYASLTLTVENNVGRSLVISDNGGDGDIDFVDDNFSRRVNYTYDANGYLNNAEISKTGMTSFTLADFDVIPNATTKGWDVKSYDPTDTTTPIVTQTVNRLGQVEKFVDRENNDSYFYPSQRRGETMSVTGAVSTSFTNHQGLTYKTVDALGYEATSTYFGNGLLKRATASDGKAVQYDYNKYGQKTSARVYPDNGSGGTDETEYLETTYDYDTLANRLQLLSITTPDLDGAVSNDNVTSYEYDTDGFITKMILPNVDVYDNATSSNSKSRPETVYAYTTKTAVGGGTLKLLEKVTNADGTVAKTDYFNTGLAQTVTKDYHATPASGLNIESHYTYDALGNQLTGEDHRENESRVEFNILRQVKKTSLYDYQEKVWKWGTNGTAPYSTYETRTYGDVLYIFDAAGRQTQVTQDNDNNIIINYTEYDDLGRVHKTKDRALDTTTYNYTEVLTTPITVTAPTGYTDPVLVSMAEVIDPEGRKSHVYTDILGRAIRSVVAPDSTTDKYTEDRGYNDSGQLAWVKDGNGNVTKYTYDNYGRALRTTYPDTSYTEALCYDDDGQPKYLFKRDGSFFELTYDAFGRIQKREVYENDGSVNFNQSTCSHSGYELERTYDFGFDILGRAIMAKVTKDAWSNTITTAYDALGRKVEETGGDGYGTTYTYDDDENETTITYDDPGSDTYKVVELRNFRNQIQAITEKRNSDPDKVLATFDYTEAGRLKEQQTGADRKITYSYENDGDLASVSNTLHTSTGGSADYTYTYNAAGQIASKDVSTVYQWSPEQNIEHDYNINNLNQAYEVDTSINGGSAVTTDIEWDINGNMTDKGARELTWSVENYLEKVVESSITLGEYKYDAMGRRIEKIASGSTTKYIMDGGNVVAEYSGSTLLRRYVYGPGVDRPIAMITPDGSGVDREYYHYDGQGNVIALVDDNHTVTGSYSYDPYGKVDTINGASGNVYRYTGRRLDAETGYYYYRARYYDSEMGRFLSADPIGYGDGLNMYAYTGNDPLNMSDPSGTDGICDRNGGRSKCQVYTFISDGGSGGDDSGSGSGGGGNSNGGGNGLTSSEWIGDTNIVTAPRISFIRVQPPMTLVQHIAHNLANDSSEYNEDSTSNFFDTAINGLNTFAYNTSMTLYGISDAFTFGLFSRGAEALPFLNIQINRNHLSYQTGLWGTTIVSGVGIGIKALTKTADYATTRLVIGASDDLKAFGAIGANEKVLRFASQGSPRATWRENYRLLRTEMSRGVPIRDASVHASGRRITSNTSNYYLRAERFTLKSRGWDYDRASRLYIPPR